MRVIRYEEFLLAVPIQIHDDGILKCNPSLVRGCKRHRRIDLGSVVTPEHDIERPAVDEDVIRQAVPVEIHRLEPRHWVDAIELISATQPEPGCIPVVIE